MFPLFVDSYLLSYRRSPAFPTLLTPNLVAEAMRRCHLAQPVSPSVETVTPKVQAGAGFRLEAIPPPPQATDLLGAPHSPTRPSLLSLVCSSTGHKNLLVSRWNLP